MKTLMLLQQGTGLGVLSISPVAGETFPPLREFQAATINPTTSCGWEWMFSNPSSNLAENQHGVQWGQRI